MLKKFLWIALAVSGAAMAAPSEYTASNVQMTARPGASLLGKLTPATPVQVLETKDGQSRVLLSGWALKEFPSTVFQAPGLRIEYGSFDEEDAVKPVAGGKTEVVQDNPWVQVQVEGWVPSDHLTPDLNALWEAGQKREAAACSQCHPAPHADHFTANQWASLLPLKGGRTGHTRAGANALMFKYLQEHAKPLK